MIVSILLHGAAGLMIVSLIAWAVAAWLSVWLAVGLWLLGTIGVVLMVVFARGALGPHGGG